MVVAASSIWVVVISEGVVVVGEESSMGVGVSLSDSDDALFLFTFGPNRIPPALDWQSMRPISLAEVIQ